MPTVMMDFAAGKPQVEECHWIPAPPPPPNLPQPSLAVRASPTFLANVFSLRFLNEQLSQSLSASAHICTSSRQAFVYLASAFTSPQNDGSVQNRLSVAANYSGRRRLRQHLQAN